MRMTMPEADTADTAAAADAADTKTTGTTSLFQCPIQGKRVSDGTRGGMAVVKAIDTAARKVPVSVWIGMAVVVLMAVVAGLGRGAANRRPALTGRSLTAARSLLASAAQLSAQADQDLDPRQRSKDVHTSLAYINAARFLAPDDVLQARCGVKVEELFATVRAQEATFDSKAAAPV